MAKDTRYSIKIGGAAGLGIKTAGLIIAKTLKRNGYFTFGYTEYPSLIKGGHNVYQIEVDQKEFASVSREVNILIALDLLTITTHKDEMTGGSFLIYDSAQIVLEPSLEASLKEKKVSLVQAPLLDIANKNQGNVLMKNTVALGILWKLLGLDIQQLNLVLAETYNKSDEMIKANQACAKGGYDFCSAAKDPAFNLKPDPAFKDYLLVTGNESIAFSAIASGVRLYSSYPMTPASSILTILAEEGPTYGMVVKQAEDEITAVNMVIGANFAGTRSMLGTSGGGFDLMTEALSLSGITETPLTAVIAQRPGPGTGAPTWSLQSDLNLAVFAGHGEFPRIVLSVSDAEDAFYLTSEALNLAEKFQTPVLILTEKNIAESNYCVPKFDQSKISIDRGEVIIKSGDSDQTNLLRYQDTDSGISPRWFPGDKIATFLASSDEHTEIGYSTEESKDIQKMYAKRLKKEKAILESLPEPELFGETDSPDLLIVSWGSNKSVIIDSMNDLSSLGKKIAYLHYTYLWPLKTGKLHDMMNKSKKTIAIELNATKQLTKLIARESEIKINDVFLKYDGRPWYIEEINEIIETN